MKADKTRSERLEFRVEASEKEAFQLAAESSGVPLSSWIRERLRKAARNDLEDAGVRVPFMANGKRP
jgi:uncharacterized protein (DUF1778 family)